MEQEQMIELLNSDNFEERIKNLTYDERYTILSSNLYIAGILINKLIERNMKLFDREESIKAFMEWKKLIDNSQYDNTLSNDTVMILDLPDEILLEEFIHTGKGVYIEQIKDPSKLLEMKYINLDNISGFIRYLPDDILEKMLHNRKYRDYFPDIIESFGSDEKIIKYLNKLSSYDKSSAVAQLDEDNIKKYLDDYKFKKDEVIPSIRDDRKKERLYIHYKDLMTDEEKTTIIASFKDISIMTKYLEQLKTEEEIYIFAYELIGYHPIMDTELYRNLLLSITNERYITDILVNKKTSRDDIDFQKNLLDKINNPKYLNEILNSTNYELIQYILPKLQQKDIIKYVKENMEFIYDYHLLLYIEDKNLLFKTLSHYHFDHEFNEDMLPIFKAVAEKYNLNLIHLVILAKISNCSILRLVENKNIQNAINLDEENFEKYIKIFERKNIVVDRNSVYTILNAILSRKFSLDYPNKIEIFINTLHDVQFGRIDSAIKNIKEVLSKINLDNYDTPPLQIINGVLKGDQEIITIYNKMTYEYLKLEKNNYVKKNIGKELFNITKPGYEPNSLIKFMLKSIPTDELIKIIKRGNICDLSEAEKNMLNNDELLLTIIEFKKNPSNGLDDNYNKYLKDFNELLKKIFSSYYFNNCKIMRIEGLNIQYNLGDLDKHSLIEIMSEIDVDKLKDLVFTNPELYDELLNYLDSYDILGCSKLFQNSSKQADVEISPSVIGSLISNYAYISEKKKERISHGERVTFLSELALADCLDSDASIYSYLFGLEDYRFLRRNGGNNASPKSKQFRINHAVEYLKTMHSRKYITVPPVNKNYTLKGGKSINVILGNTNDPINLTYGERTGACMRIGGAGDSLFDFCLKNENGFHISFNNPNTGELISRVSCYRNGNTVFFNQLRHSLDLEYSDEMLREACSLIAREIIQNTKNSNYPVLNVVTSDCYAYEGCSTTNTGCPEPTKGYHPQFYTDVGERAVVVATSGEGLSPIKLGPGNAEKYRVGRSPIKKYGEDKAPNAIARIEALDAFYSKVPLDEIEIKEKNIVLVYVGEDWYVAMTKDCKIIHYLQKNSNDPIKAEEEMQEHLNIVKNMLNTSSIEEIRNKVNE